MRAIHHILLDSMLLTLARKLKTSMRKERRKRKRRGNHIPYFIATGVSTKGNQLTAKFGDFDTKYKRDFSQMPDVNVIIQNVIISTGRSTIIQRLEADKCEICESQRV